MIARIKGWLKLPGVKKYGPIILLIIFASICLRIAIPKEIIVHAYQGKKILGSDWDVNISGSVYAK